VTTRRQITRQQVDVVLDADLLAAMQRVGTPFHAEGSGSGVFSFKYNLAWIDAPHAFQIDPQLALHTSESYPIGDESGFRIFLDSAPDRWGRVLLDRR